MFRIILALLLLLSLTAPGFTQAQYNSEIPQAGDNPINFPTAVAPNNATLIRTLFNYRQGDYLLYDNASTITVGSGEIACNSATGNTQGQTVVFRQNTSSVNATTANLDTGNSFSASTTYYVYASCDASATTFTVVISLNASTPSGVTNYKLLGNFTTDSSSNIAQIIDNAVVSHFAALQTSQTVNTVYQATTDGIVSAWGAGSGQNVYIQCITDNSPTPSTVIFQSGPGNTNVGSFPGCTISVRKGDYWKVVTSGAFSSTSVSWRPFGQ